MNPYFPEPYQNYGQNVKIELDMSNYAAEPDLKRATIIYTSTLGLKTDMTRLKTKVDNLDLDKLKAIPADFIKLSNLKDTEVFKKAVCYRLVAKVNAIDTKIPSTCGLPAKTVYDSYKQGF